MKLAASLLARNELHRYLKPCIEHLRAFCDTIVVLDDASDDGTGAWLDAQADEQLAVARLETPHFYAHEGQTRQKLIDITLATKPSAVLSLDMDEFVSAGQELRARLEAEPDVPVWSLEMQEVWAAREDGLLVRCDGGWRPHPLPVLWKAPREGQKFTMRDKKLACGRVPTQVLAQRARPIGLDILHWGWTDPKTRQQRYDRYTKHDGGKFHASSHLRSIMWPESRMRFVQRPWPAGPVFDQLRERFMVSA